MRLSKLTLTAFRGFSEKFELPVGGYNLLVFGENGTSKSSIAKALELLFEPRIGADLLFHKNVFGATQPTIKAEFIGQVTQTRPSDGKKFRKSVKESLAWSPGAPKPLPPWLLQSAAQSAFLDHRKLLLLSDPHRELAKSFFITAVQHLFANLPVGATGQTLVGLWADIQNGVSAFGQAVNSRGRSSRTGVRASVAHHIAIERDVNELNRAMNNYLQPQRGQAKGVLVAKAQQLLGKFENLQLKIDLDYEDLAIDRNTGQLSGGLIHPHVEYCSRRLESLVNGSMKPTHHYVLNEGRLTALALSLFFAALRLQEGPPGTAQGQLARLIVLDDVLIGLDYEHRFPVLDILRKEFLRAKRYQLILLTHNREWFDLCRLKVGVRGWAHVEFYAKHEAGPSKSDCPMIKKGSSDYVKRAKEFIDQDHDLPAAANYARTAVEWAMKELCAKKSLPIPFNLEPHRMNTEVFLNALTGKLGKKKGRKKIIKKGLQTDLEALRRTVLNAYSHWHPTTAVESDVRRAISVAEQLVDLAK